MINKTQVQRLIENKAEGNNLDYKENIVLITDGDKAKFVKDVLSLANSEGLSHLIVGVEDNTWKLVGMKSQFSLDQLNQILKGKTDPQLSVEYAEKKILGHTVGVIEINGENRPYIVGVQDKYGGQLTNGSANKPFYIERGTIFVRNHNFNEGVLRANLDKMYDIKYISLESDIYLSHEVETTWIKNDTEAKITFWLENSGDALASDILIWIRFTNIKKIIECGAGWEDLTALNHGQHTTQRCYEFPVIAPLRMRCSWVKVQIDDNTNQIETRIIIGASNMKSKDMAYNIPLYKTADEYDPDELDPDAYRNISSALCSCLGVSISSNRFAAAS